MNIKEFIKEKRPNISESSIQTYSSILRSLHKKVFGEKNFETDDFDNTDKILKFLSDLEPNKRKSILSALVVITNNKKYREQMLDDIREYNKEISEQKKTESQEENWVNQNDIKDLYEDLKTNAENLYKKKNINNSDLQQIQNYVIVSLLGGVIGDYPIRRSKDYVDFKVGNIDKEKDNFLEGNYCIFNSYKTAKFYNQQKIFCPPKLRNILKKWISINPTEYLLFDTNFNQLSSVKLNQRLNKLFGKKVGVNILRHSILTDKFGDQIKKNKEIDKVLSDMGSSAQQLKVYVKKD